MKLRLADYVASKLAEHGIEHVFLVTGGGAMHLNDAFGRCRAMKYVAFHHEQACAMAAQSYYRLTNRLCAVNVTTGPGGTNAITGVFGAWVDSLGMIVVSGQVKWETLVRSTGLPLRQLGDQEVDITALVGPITKYAVVVTDPMTIRYHLERALHLATAGRPGPVWLDIPMNVQGAMIETDDLRAYDPAEDPAPLSSDIAAAADDVIARLRAAKRPVILPGTGVRLARADREFLALIDKLGVPVVTAFNAHDLVPDDHPLYCGRPGTVGDRSGNFAVQNADFVLVLGCRLNIRQVSYNWGSFARGAFRAMVDIDRAELDKPTLSIDLKIHADAREFIVALTDRASGVTADAHREFLAFSRARREKYPVVLPEYWQTKGSVNPYCFGHALFEALPEDAIVVTGDGTACVTTFQAARIKRGQRLYSDSGSAPMGYDLPAAIGAAVASGKRVVCVTGDGSIMMNLQELQTIATNRLDVKVFLLNNRGYHSIRQTQKAFFSDNIVGCGTESGLGFPDFEKLSSAFGFHYMRISDQQSLRDGIVETMRSDGAAICEVLIDLAQSFAPKLGSRRLDDGRMVTSPLEDMSPLLSREELRENLLIDPIE